jgi:DNA-binding beta-propeller fold protein YncE
LRRLRQRFPDELAVIGVHSAKFPTEKRTSSIREAVQRHAIDHPVVNDAEFDVWQQYAVRAWPTIAVIDPRGYYLGAIPGEIDADALAPVIEKLIEVHDAQGEIDRRPLGARPAGASSLRTSEAADSSRSPRSADGATLSYPSKLIITSESTLFVADMGHHRVLQLELAPDQRSAAIARVFGDGRAALEDGAADRASFHSPHGLARRGSTLYVADTENHAVRAIDLESGAVRTVAGTGEKARHHFQPGKSPTETPLRSPWGLWVQRPRLFIAMAGSHQVFSLEDEKTLLPFAGSGREALVDGPALAAGFNQPSDLAGNGRELFVADAEASAVRSIAIDGKPIATTLVGAGLFEFGDVDGIGERVRLQHPAGIAFDGLIFIADSYNHKIKRLDPSTREVKKFIGTGEPGRVDGPFYQAQLSEPEGVAVRDKYVYVADTNNHAIRVGDMKSMRLHTLEIMA